jgi:hypothetical protein
VWDLQLLLVPSGGIGGWLTEPCWRLDIDQAVHYSVQHACLVDFPPVVELVELEPVHRTMTSIILVTTNSKFAIDSTGFTVLELN